MDAKKEKTIWMEWIPNHLLFSQSLVFHCRLTQCELWECYRQAKRGNDDIGLLWTRLQVFQEPQAKLHNAVAYGPLNLLTGHVPITERIKVLLRGAFFLPRRGNQGWRICFEVIWRNCECFCGGIKGTLQILKGDWSVRSLNMYTPSRM